ncbi:MAG: MFS transporter [Treponema sp.]|jgi:DHA3 family macrolide efflux protein-like MFS transporter|nr:MFS transporter [Treponema sp.]
MTSWKRNFYIMSAGQAVSYIGSAAVQFSLIWWLTKETGSALMLSLAGLCAHLPQALLGPFAGVWVDRLKRKTVIIAADMFTGLAALAFASAFFFRPPPAWAVCAVLGIRAIGGVFQYPAGAAAISLLVPKEELVKANSVSQFIMVGSFMLGPVIGAAMSAAWSMEIILLSDTAGALAACAAVAVIKIPELAPAVREKKRFFQEMKDGAAIYIEDKKLFFLVVFSMLVMLFIMPLSSMYPLMVYKHFGGREWQLSIVQVVYGAGMLAGAVVMGALGGRIKNKIAASVGGLFIYAVTCLASGALPPTAAGLWLFAGICVVMGSGNNVFNIPLMAYMQETIPNEKQGRAFSLLSCLMSLAMPVGLVIAGPAAENFGVAFYFLIAGGVSLVITVICLFTVRKHSA